MLGLRRVKVCQGGPREGKGPRGLRACAKGRYCHRSYNQAGEEVNKVIKGLTDSKGGKFGGMEVSTGAKNRVEVTVNYLNTGSGGQRMGV